MVDHHHQRLVEKARTGEHSAFRELMECHQQKIYYLAFDLTGNHHDAEDLSQETFIRVFRTLKNFRGEASLSSWLYRIMVNLYIDRQRKKSTTFLEFHEDVESKQNPDIRISSTHDPAHDTEIHLLQKHIEQALQRLSARQRSVFTLRHYHHMGIREIADTLEIAEGTVKSLLFRAIQILQKELAFYRADPDEEYEP